MLRLHERGELNGSDVIFIKTYETAESYNQIKGQTVLFTKEGIPVHVVKTDRIASVACGPSAGDPIIKTPIPLSPSKSDDTSKYVAAEAVVDDYALGY